MADTFSLSIDFAGLCLFVPEPGKEAMHVLMPDAAKHSGHGKPLEKHAVHLMVDSAYLRPNQTQLDHLEIHIPLNGRWLTMPGNGSPAIASVGGEVGTLSGTLRPGALTGTADGMLAARVTLPSGQGTPHEQGACWEWKLPQPRRMSHRVKWTVPKLGKPGFDLELKGLGGRAGPTFTVFSIDDAIEIKIWHAQPAEFPPHPAEPGEPEYKADAHHFGSYYDLVLGTDKKLPKFRKNDCKQGGLRSADDADKGASPYTCMSAQFEEKE